MKWYLEFLFLWIVIFVLTFFWRLIYERAVIAFFVSIVISLIVTGILYAGYAEGKKRIKLKTATEEEKAEIQRKEKKTTRLMYWIILALVIVCVILIAIVTLIKP